MPTAGADLSMQGAHTLFLRFEDVVIAFRYLWDNTNGTAAPKLVNDGFVFHANREAFQLVHNKAVRLTLQHPNNGKAALAMWWKVAEGIHTAADFAAFRKQVLETPVSVKEENGTIDIALQTKARKLGLKADLVKKKRLAYYYPVSMPKDYLFMVNGKEIGLPIMKKYQSQ